MDSKLEQGWSKCRDEGFARMECSWCDGSGIFAKDGPNHGHSCPECDGHGWHLIYEPTYFTDEWIAEQPEAYIERINKLREELAQEIEEGGRKATMGFANRCLECEEISKAHDLGSNNHWIEGVEKQVDELKIKRSISRPANEEVEFER